jgi:hypothetical protein
LGPPKERFLADRFPVSPGNLVTALQQCRARLVQVFLSQGLQKLAAGTAELICVTLTRNSRFPDSDPELSILKKRFPERDGLLGQALV